MNTSTLARYANGKERKNSGLLSEFSRKFNREVSPIVSAKTFTEERSGIIVFDLFAALCFGIVGAIFNLKEMIAGVGAMIGVGILSLWGNRNWHFRNAREFAECMTELEKAVTAEKTCGNVRYPEFGSWDSSWAHHHYLGIATDFLRKKATLIRSRQAREGEILEWELKKYRLQTEKLRLSFQESLRKLSKLFPGELPVNGGFYYGTQEPRYSRRKHKAKPVC